MRAITHRIAFAFVGAYAEQLGRVTRGIASLSAVQRGRANTAARIMADRPKALDLSSRGASGGRSARQPSKSRVTVSRRPQRSPPRPRARIFKLRNLPPLHRLPPRAKLPITAFAAIRIAQRWR
jgi:hypothetical protein